MKNSQKGFANLILIGVIIALIVIGGYFAFVKRTGLIVQQPIPVVTQTNITTPTSTDETANWKTYTNSEYGFEVKYPMNLLIYYNQPAGIRQVEFVASPTSGITFDVSIFPTSDPVAESYGPDWQRQGEVTVDSYKATKVSRSGSDGLNGTSYIISDKNISIDFPADTASFSFANQVLSTFKFTK